MTTSQAGTKIVAAKSHAQSGHDQAAARATSFDDVMAQHASDVTAQNTQTQGTNKAARPDKAAKAAQGAPDHDSAADDRVDAAAADAAQTPKDSKAARADKDKDSKADDKDMVAAAADDAANDNAQSLTPDASLVLQPQMAAPAPVAATPQDVDQAGLIADAAAGRAATPNVPPAPANDADDADEADGAEATEQAAATSAGLAQPASEFQKLLGAAKNTAKDDADVEPAADKDTKPADAKAADLKPATPVEAKLDTNPTLATAMHSAPASAAADKIAATAQSASANPPAQNHPAPNVTGLAVEIAAKSQSGAKQFNIRLDPPELGRVEVRLSIDATGKAQAHLSADHPQTLDLLQKDAPMLTRALREAGLEVNPDGLNFSLRNPQQDAGNGQRDSQSNPHNGRGTFAAGAVSETSSATGSAYSGGLGLLDIKV